MDAKKLLKEWKRMCDGMDDGSADGCEKCIGGKINCTCCAFEMSEEDIDTIVKMVEEWSEENPIRTYKDVLLEKFPNAIMSNSYNCPRICLRDAFGYKHNPAGGDKSCREWTCEECWNREYKEI